MSEHMTEIYREDADGNEIMIPVRVEYAHHRAIRGQRDSICGVRGAGPPLEPDEPEHVEIERVTGPDGVMELTADEREAMESEIMQAIADSGFDRD